ncbi:hypothetical protein Ancab_004172 [Ancistrocladus abbreviatus]
MVDKLNSVSPFRLSSLLRLQKDPKLALQLFLDPNPNSNPKQFKYTLLSYDLIITKLGRAKMFDELDQVLSKLKLETRFIPKEIIFCNVMTYYSRARMPEKALEIFDEITSYRCRRTVKSLNSLLNGLLICREFDKMERIFMGINIFACPDACTYNIMINACQVHGDLSGASKVFNEMCERGFQPNTVTFATLIGGLCANSMLKEAFKLKRDMWRIYKVRPNCYVYASLMKGLCWANELTLALKLKDEMLDKKIQLDSAIYTSLISGLFKAGKKMEVYQVLEEMRRKKCKPNTATFNALIAGFCGERNFKLALRVLKEMEDVACKPDVVSYNILIRGYCKEGKLREATDLFEDMPRRGCTPDVVSYRILLDGLLDSLEFKEATFVLDEMFFKGYSPHFSSINKFVDGLCQEGEIESLLVVLSTLANGKLIDAHTWQMAISTVCKVELLNSCELLDNLVI